MKGIFDQRFAALISVASLATVACGPASTSEPSESTATSLTATSSTGVAAARPAVPDPVIDEAHKDWVPVGGGKLVQPACRQVVPSGAHVDGLGNVSVGGKPIPQSNACDQPALVFPRPHGGTSHTDTSTNVVQHAGTTIAHSWLLNTWANASTYFNWASGTWVVPPAPTDSTGPEQIFLFDSFQSADNSNMIIQPEIYWSQGTGWQIQAEFYYNLPNGGSHDQVSAPVKVSAGDTISGLIQQTGEYTWEIQVADQTTNPYWYYTTLNVTAQDMNGNQEFTSVQGAVMEVYNVNTCSDLPGSYTNFGSQTVYQAEDSSPLDWNKAYDGFPAFTGNVAPWSTLYPDGQSPLGTGCSFSIAATSGGGTSLEY